MCSEIQKLWASKFTNHQTLSLLQISPVAGGRWEQQKADALSVCREPPWGWGLKDIIELGKGEKKKALQQADE